MQKEFSNPEEAIAAFDRAVEEFRNTDYDSVDELEAQEDALIAAAYRTIRFLNGGGQ